MKGFICQATYCWKTSIHTPVTAQGTLNTSMYNLKTTQERTNRAGSKGRSMVCSALPDILIPQRRAKHEAMHRTNAQPCHRPRHFDAFRGLCELRSFANCKDTETLSTATLRSRALNWGAHCASFKVPASRIVRHQLAGNSVPRNQVQTHDNKLFNTWQHNTS